jgi:hypothetical protein
MSRGGCPADASSPTTAGHVADLSRGSALNVVDACRVSGHELTPTGWSVRDDERV